MYTNKFRTTVTAQHPTVFYCSDRFVTNDVCQHKTNSGLLIRLRLIVLIIFISFHIIFHHHLRFLLEGQFNHRCGQSDIIPLFHSHLRHVVLASRTPVINYRGSLYYHVNTRMHSSKRIFQKALAVWMFPGPWTLGFPTSTFKGVPIKP